MYITPNQNQSSQSKLALEEAWLQYSIMWCRNGVRKVWWKGKKRIGIVSVHEIWDENEVAERWGGGVCI